MSGRRFPLQILQFALAPAVIAAGTHDLLKRPPAWFASDEAKKIAANILLIQSDYGGWPKNMEFTAAPLAGDEGDLAGRFKPTFDGDATTGEVRFMARMHEATGDVRYLRALENAIDYITLAQDPAGGWPQSYPQGPADRRHVTFDEEATGRIMLLLQEVETSKEFAFLDADRRHAVKSAFQRGFKCIGKASPAWKARLTITGPGETAPSWQPKVRIALAGDSTVKDEGGWGFGFKKRLSADVLCENFAQGGQSSKSFRDTGWWQKVLASKPDYVLIQFGHNDGPGKGANRATDPATTYPENMTRFIVEARQAGARPVLVTSLARRIFQPDGKLRGELAPYVEAARKVAAEQHVPLIDLYALSVGLVEKLGPAGVEPFEPKILPTPATKAGAAADGPAAPKPLPADIDVPPPSAKPRHDGTHLTARGSLAFGAIVAEEFLRVVPESKVELKQAPHKTSTGSNP